jgi:hypothetical protein
MTCIQNTEIIPTSHWSGFQRILMKQQNGTGRAVHKTRDCSLDVSMLTYKWEQPLSTDRKSAILNSYEACQVPWDTWKNPLMALRKPRFILTRKADRKRS